MGKIPKNLSDKAMFTGYKEGKKDQSLFDIAKEFDEGNTAKSRVEKKEAGYIDKYLADALNKELLKLKLDLYKDGIIDYQIKVSRKDKQIILNPVIKKGHNKK